MYDCFFCTLQCFEGFMDDVGSALCQHLYGNIIGNQVVVNQASCKFKFGIACRREADFDFLKPCIHQKLEEFQDWLPSLMSTLHHTGAFVMVLLGHLRLGMSIVG